VLALLLQTIDKSLGPSLSLAAPLAFVIGAAMLIYVIAAPAMRIAIEMRAAAVGLERYWVMQCPTCKRDTIVLGGSCEHCAKSLGLPWFVRLRNALAPEGEPRWLRPIRWTLTGLCVAAFAALTIACALKSGVWNPQGNLERLFAGLAMIAWAGFGWLAGRVIGFGGGGLLARGRDAVFALVMIGALAALLTLAGASRPVEEAVLARVTVEGQRAEVNGQAIPLVGSQLGFEYLQVDHELAGFQRVVPLAIVGAQRVNLVTGSIEETVVDHLWEHAAAYTARGLSVRKRTEQFLAPDPGTYEVVLHGREIGVRREAAPTNG